MKNNYISQLFSTSRLLLTSLIIMLGFSEVAVGQNELATLNASGTYTVPPGVFSITVECWGGGGGGGSARTTNGAAGGGGGGGAYTKSILVVTPGTIVNFTIGAGGTGGTTGNNAALATAGGSTTFLSVVAGGGGAGGNSTINTAGGTGGTGGSTGTYNGGNGATGLFGNNGGGGGGGSSAAVGGVGTNATGINGGTLTGGGSGGNGSKGGGGTAGSTPGGGGAGGHRTNNNDKNGGAGGAGQIKVSWTTPTEIGTPQKIKIGYKSGTVNDNDYGIGGSDRASTASKLLNPANFGPAGISPYTFELYDFGTTPITAAALESNGIQILDLGINKADAGSGSTYASYSTNEINAIKAWTISSNKHVVLAFQGFARALGGTSYTAVGSGNDNPNVITQTGQSILSGPFGITQSFDQGGTYQGTFSKYPLNSCVLVQDATPDPTGLIDDATGDIYLADVGLIGITGGLTPNSAAISSNTDKFLANLYHGMARIVQYGPNPVCDFISCPAGINGPSLSSTSLNIKCPSTTGDLTTLFNGTLPVNTSLVWYTNPDRIGDPYPTPSQAVAGTYYAFFYNLPNNCYSPASYQVTAEPGISINNSSLSGFSYIFGNGPSAQQTLIVSGSCLVDNITINPPTNFEISLDGITYTTSIIVLPKQTDGSVNNTNIYVRLVKDLAIGNYSDNLILSSANANSKYVALFGTVTRPYCNSTGNTNADYSITLVNFNTINNITEKPSAYSDYSTTLSTNVLAGNFYYLTVNVKTKLDYTYYDRYYQQNINVYFNTYCNAWIDWNRDGDFNDVGEAFDLGVNNTTLNGPTSNSPYKITIPSDAAVGPTRMRISCSYNSSNTNPCVTGLTGEIEDYTINISKNYWRGNSSNDWGTKSNWTAGFVPNYGEDVIFSTGSPYSIATRDLVLDKDRTIGNLENLTQMKLEIPAGKGLVVNNNINTQNDPNRILIKSNATTNNGSLIFKNATDVYGSVEMYSKAYISGDPNDPESSFFWQYFGIPVKTLDAVPTFYGAYVRRSNEKGEEDSYTNYYWTEIGTYDKLTQFLGYELCQKDKTTYTFKGQLVNEDFDSELLPISPLPAKYPGQHLFANPYTAAINIDQIQFGADMDNTIYLYNTGSYGQWADLTINTSSGNAPGQYLSIPKNNAGANGLTSEIPSMSSFLVKTGGNATLGSRVQINYKDAVGKNTTAQKVKSIDGITNTDLVSTKIDLIGQHYSDCMWIFSEPSCTRNFDNGWDGKKILGSSLAPQIYAMEPDGDYQVNSVSDMNNTDLAFQAGDEVEYTLKFTHENIQQRYAGVYLTDLIEHKTVDISQDGSTYSFATAQSDAPAKRFKILTRSYEKGTPDKEAQVKIFTAPGRVFVHNLSAFKGECTLYDIAGRAIKNASFAANAVTEVLNNLPPGAYVVNTITNGEKVSKRVIVQ